MFDYPNTIFNITKTIYFAPDHKIGDQSIYSIILSGGIPFAIILSVILFIGVLIDYSPFKNNEFQVNYLIKYSRLSYLVLYLLMLIGALLLGQIIGIVIGPIIFFLAIIVAGVSFIMLVTVIPVGVFVMCINNTIRYCIVGTQWLSHKPIDYKLLEPLGDSKV